MPPLTEKVTTRITSTVFTTVPYPLQTTITPTDRLQFFVEKYLAWLQQAHEERLAAGERWSEATSEADKQAAKWTYIRAVFSISLFKIGIVLWFWPNFQDFRAAVRRNGAMPNVGWQLGNALRIAGLFVVANVTGFISGLKGGDAGEENADGEDAVIVEGAGRVLHHRIGHNGPENSPGPVIVQAQIASRSSVGSADQRNELRQRQTRGGSRG